ncbi:MAG: transposase [Nitrospirae bacterium]|nr:transposase [Nitrospirota bacterium]
MARPLRLEYPGAVYHVTSRGDRREKICEADADRALFLDLLAQTVGRFPWVCHAYCLMDNHYHLLIETLEPSLSRGMRHLNGVYTQRLNRRYGRVGHVFSGRFKAIVVQKDSHLLELCRYVVLNPIRAGVKKRAQDWPWSSYRATSGLDSVPAWLTVDWVLGQFGSKRSPAMRAYRRFVAEGLGQTPWEGLVGQIYYGDEGFVRDLATGERVEEVPRVHKRPVRLPLSALVRTGSAAEVGRAYMVHGYRLREIASQMGVHYSTVSRRLREYEQAK